MIAVIELLYQLHYHHQAAVFTIVSGKWSSCIFQPRHLLWPVFDQIACATVTSPIDVIVCKISEDKMTPCRRNEEGTSCCTMFHDGTPCIRTPQILWAVFFCGQFLGTICGRYGSLYLYGRGPHTTYNTDRALAAS